MGKINPVESASRVAGRARVEAEAAQAKAELKSVEYFLLSAKVQPLLLPLFYMLSISLAMS